MSYRSTWCRNVVTQCSRKKCWTLIEGKTMDDAGRIATPKPATCFLQHHHFLQKKTVAYATHRTGVAAAATSSTHTKLSFGKLFHTKKMSGKKCWPNLLKEEEIEYIWRRSPFSRLQTLKKFFTCLNMFQTYNYRSGFSWPLKTKFEILEPQKSSLKFRQ